MAALVMVELLLRWFDDDDDDEGGKGIRIVKEEMTPAYAPSGAWLIIHIIIGEMQHVGMAVSQWAEYWS